MNDQHTAHEMLWMMVEFDQVSDTHIDSLVADLLERGRLDEAEKIKHKKSANVDGPAKSPPNNPTVGTVVVRENVVHDDVLAVEFPLFLRINARQPIILMRTPKTSLDSDHNLAYGFLYGERVIESLDDVRAIQHCDDAQNPMRSHTLNVSLESGCSLKSIQERRDPIYSACGGPVVEHR